MTKSSTGCSGTDRPLVRASDDVGEQRLVQGQWFTPPDVAALALNLCVAGRGASRIADLTCGDGAFLRAALAAGVPAEQLVGVELDGDVAARARADAPGVQVLNRDLFSIEPGEIDADLVVGNPPYVRQERLTDDVKERVRERLGRDWPDLSDRELGRLVGRGDLAAACTARILRLLPVGGRAALVLSSALFDAGYADPLWKLMARHGRVVAIVDAPEERWFADAAVNAVIVVFERGAPTHDETLIARLRVPTREAARAVGGCGELGRVATVYRSHSDEPHRWSVLLRAAPAWFSFEDLAGPLLVPLSTLADIRRGVTSGGNDIFYLDRERSRRIGLPSRYLRPLVRSPRDRAASRIEIDPSETDWHALVLPGSLELADEPAVDAYLAQHAAAASRPTLRNRNPWWALPARPARLFLTKAYAARFVQRMSPDPVVADQRVYAIEPRGGVTVEQLAAVLNSTFTALALESLGRASMGEGALEWTVGDARQLPVIDPRRLSADQRVELVNALDVMKRREIGAVQQEQKAPDRRRLDCALAQGFPRLVGLLDELHLALVKSTASRAARAGSAS